VIVIDEWLSRMVIGAVKDFTNALQQRLSTTLVWLGDAIAFLSGTAWSVVDLLIRIWIGKSALVLSVLISTDWTTVVRMAEAPIRSRTSASGPRRF